MKNFSLVWNYYSRKDVQEALLEVTKDREIVGVFSNGNFGKRPNVLVYPQDILEMVKEGVVSFHGSVERWSNPMVLESGMIKQELDKLRIGWDLIIDPDCPDFEVAKLTTKIVIDALRDHGIKNYSIKLTGGKSFHIGLPFEIFPDKINFMETAKIYPELPQKIIEYMKNYVKDQLKEEILALDNPLATAQKIGKSITEITDKDGLDPLKVVQIDSMLVASRHMFRLPFSLHEKTLLVSLPIEVSELNKLKKEDAEPSKVKFKAKFLDRKLSIKEANTLVIESMDWSSKHGIMEEKTPYQGPKMKIREIGKNLFPPCIQKILNGMPDGRKRSVFVLNNFLRNMGWNSDKIETELIQWNEKNRPPLQQRYVRTQFRWHDRQKQNFLPPNCDNQNFYLSMNVCLPDEICKAGTSKITIKNPVNYPFRKMKRK
jgi:DNA primase catalytic subunit